MLRSGRVDQWLRTHQTCLRPQVQPQHHKEKQGGRKKKQGGRDRQKEGERETGRREKKKMFKVTSRSIPLCFSEQILRLQVSKYPEIILK